MGSTMQRRQAQGKREGLIEVPQKPSEAAKEATEKPSAPGAAEEVPLSTAPQAGPAVVPVVRGRYAGLEVAALGPDGRPRRPPKVTLLTASLMLAYIGFALIWPDKAIFVLPLLVVALWLLQES